MKTKTALLITVSLISIILTGGALAVFGSTVPMPSPSWSTKTALPAARGQPAVIAGDNGLIYVMGGYFGGVEVTTVYAYDPLTETWTNKAPLPVAARGAAVAKASNGLIYVIGGYQGFSTLAAVQAYNATSNAWTTKTSIPVGVWMAGAAAGNDGRIYVIGGEDPSGTEINSTQIYDSIADTWATGANMSVKRSELGVAKGHDGLIYAMGGWNGTSAISSVEAYNPVTDMWTTKAPMPSPKLEFGITLGPDKKIYVIGGGTNYGNNAAPVFNTVDIFDTKTSAWTTPLWSESYLPTARKELGATTGTNGRIYAIAGGNGAAYLNTNEEAFIAPPDNTLPTAYIDSISPNPATRGQTIAFTGHGSDSDGSIVAYKWRSSLNGTISTSASFSASTLAVGTHTVYLSVKDDYGTWSTEVGATVTVDKPISEDPTYQQLLDVDQGLRDATDNLTQQNADLQTEVDNLKRQNEDLSEMVDSLTTKLDTTTMILLGANIAIIVLIVVTIAVVYMSKRKPIAPAVSS